MKIEEIINNLNQYELKIIEKLSENKWRHFEKYIKIREGFLNNRFDEDFRGVFCSFYTLNRVLNDSQKTEFFNLLSSKETNLEKILRKLYKIPGHKNNHKLFLSFGTKLLHTINGNLPIYDTNIAKILALPRPSDSKLLELEEKIKNRVDIYNDLKKRFNELLTNIKINKYLKSIRKKLHYKADIDEFQWQNEYISDTKLLDSSLWALYFIKNKKTKSQKIN